MVRFDCLVAAFYATQPAEIKDGIFCVCDSYQAPSIQLHRYFRLTGLLPKKQTPTDTGSIWFCVKPPLLFNLKNLTIDNQWNKTPFCLKSKVCRTTMFFYHYFCFTIAYNSYIYYSPLKIQK